MYGNVVLLVEGHKSEEKFFRIISQKFRNGSDFGLVKRAHDEVMATLRGHVRDDGSPVITHPRAVATIGLLYNYCTDPESIAAKLLHDTVEDFPDEWSYARIKRDYGEGTARHVFYVTKPPLSRYLRPEDRSHPERVSAAKELRALDFHTKLVLAPREAKLTKLEDRLHNLMSVWVYGTKKMVEKVQETERFMIPCVAEPLGVLVEELHGACRQVPANLRFEHTAAS